MRIILFVLLLMLALVMGNSALAMSPKKTTCAHLASAYWSAATARDDSFGPNTTKSNLYADDGIPSDNLTSSRKEADRIVNEVYFGTRFRKMSPSKIGHAVFRDCVNGHRP